MTQVSGFSGTIRLCQEDKQMSTKQTHQRQSQHLFGLSVYLSRSRSVELFAAISKLTFLWTLSRKELHGAYRKFSSLCTLSGAFFVRLCNTNDSQLRLHSLTG